jgi:hypothetical protein
LQMWLVRQPYPNGLRSSTEGEPRMTVGVLHDPAKPNDASQTYRMRSRARPHRANDAQPAREAGLHACPVVTPPGPPTPSAMPTGHSGLTALCACDAHLERAQKHRS